MKAVLNTASRCLSKSEPVFLSRSQVEGLLCTADVLQVVERSFRLFAEGSAIMPPKLYLDLPSCGGDFRAMPAYIGGYAGMKWVSVYPGNGSRHLPSVIATILLCDPMTGAPIAVMDGTHITEMRTGAAGGVAVKYLARKDSSVLGMIGAGTQARSQLLAIAEVLPGIREVKVFDKAAGVAVRFAAEMSPGMQCQFHVAGSAAEAACADIVVTTTPSRQPLVFMADVKPGTHINAIGADGPGKQELEPGLLARAKVVVDDIEQARHSGEINVPVSRGQFNVEQVHGNLGDIVAGFREGRRSDGEITVFDSTGLAIHDIACAGLVYERACAGGPPAKRECGCRGAAPGGAELQTGQGRLQHVRHS